MNISSGDVFAWSIDIEQSVPDYQGYLELGVKYDFDGELNLGKGWKIYLNKYWEHAFNYYLDSPSAWNIWFVVSVLSQVRGCFYKEYLNTNYAQYLPSLCSNYSVNTNTWFKLNWLIQPDMVKRGEGQTYRGGGINDVKGESCILFQIISSHPA